MNFAIYFWKNEKQRVIYCKWLSEAVLIKHHLASWGATHTYIDYGN